jgi:hypothetical protein
MGKRISCKKKGKKSNHFSYVAEASWEEGRGTGSVASERTEVFLMGLPYLEDLFCNSTYPFRYILVFFEKNNILCF